MTDGHWISNLNDAFDRSYRNFLSDSSIRLSRNILVIAGLGAILDYEIISLSKITVQGISIEDTKQDGIKGALGILQAYFVLRFALEGLSDWKHAKYQDLLSKSEAFSLGAVEDAESAEKISRFFELSEKSAEILDKRKLVQNELSFEEFQKHCEEDGWDEVYESLKLGLGVDANMARMKFISDFLNSTKRFRMASLALSFAFTLVVGVSSILLLAM